MQVIIVGLKKTTDCCTLYSLTRNVDFSWSDECDTAFAGLKKLVSTTPVLRGPNWELPFHTSTDALDVAISTILGQEEDKKPYDIYHIRKNLTSVELNYVVTENEVLAIIYAINKFRHYITDYQVFVYNDHSAIQYLANKLITYGQVTRWLFLLQEFYITIKDRSGKENPVADFLSQIPKVNDPLAVDDQFLDEHLFSVAVKMPWHEDVANYLVVGKLLKHLTTKERKLIVQCNSWFSWIGGYLFHTGVDMCICRCIHKDEIHDILKAFHNEPCSGHFADQSTRHKVLQMGYYWPTIFKDAKKYA